MVDRTSKAEYQDQAPVATLPTPSRYHDVLLRNRTSNLGLICHRVVRWKLREEFEDAFGRLRRRREDRRTGVSGAVGEQLRWS